MLAVSRSERVARWLFFTLFLGLGVVEWLFTTAIAPVPTIPFDARLGLYAATAAVGFVWTLAQHWTMRARRSDASERTAVLSFTWPMWALTAVAAYGLTQYIIYAASYGANRDRISSSVFIEDYIALAQTAQYTVTFMLGIAAGVLLETEPGERATAGTTAGGTRRPLL